MKPPEQFETERLILRKPCLEDAPAIFTTYAQDAEVTRYMTWSPHKNIEEAYSIMQITLKSWEDGSAYSFAIILKDSRSLVGMIAMHPDSFKVEIGYVLARAYWGKGYVTEAARVVTNWLLQQPGIYRVFATCDVENLASARVMEKVGMVREGILRRNTIRQNIGKEPRDSCIYAIVK
jgi:ribosomal-protein-alanine N-acetyltransferase